MCEAVIRVGKLGLIQNEIFPLKTGVRVRASKKEPILRQTHLTSAFAH